MNDMKTVNTRATMCAALTLLTVVAACGQTAAPAPAFEVASVKPAPPPVGGKLIVDMGGDPGMIDYKNVSLKTLIAQAYEVKEFQVSGPEWIDSARFDILAKMPPDSSKHQLALMMRNLLDERFRLASHRDQKVLPVYAMVAGKDGLKVKPLGGESDEGMRVTVGPKGRRMTGPATLTDLAGILSRMLDRPVVDDTALKGTYSIDLEWVPDEREGGGIMAKMKGMAEAASGDAHGDPLGPTGLSLFQALQEKLGLKLEARKSPVDILVVDGAEKVPTEN
jgi:uncharacterized protein (TIGR03435 family)